MLDDMNSDLDCEADGVNFIDMNGDGLDDLVCIGGDGDAFLSVNQGDGDRKAKKPPSFKSVGLIKKSETTKRKYVLIADIDGDGRGDYGVMKKGRDTIEDGSSTRYDYYFWRNGWVDDKPKYWQAMGKRDSRKVDEEKTRWGGPSWPRFEDINGDVSKHHIDLPKELGADHAWIN